jgi:hypothetical protein
VADQQQHPVQAAGDSPVVTKAKQLEHALRHCSPVMVRCTLCSTWHSVQHLALILWAGLTSLASSSSLCRPTLCADLHVEWALGVLPLGRAMPQL